MDLVEQKIESVQLLDGKLLKVYRDRVRLPDGGESDREWIDHPGAAAVVPMLDDGRVILIRQFRYPVGREFIEVPAGKLDFKNEPPLDVARRELEEETGWRAGALTELGAYHMAIGYCNEVIHCYLATELEHVGSNLDSDEFLEVLFVPFDEALEMTGDGRITDVKTAVALMRAGTLLEEGKDQNHR
jgi:ADP-ribose pyrophosphatase